MKARYLLFLVTVFWTGCSSTPAVYTRDVVMAQQALETADLSFESVARDLAIIRKNNQEQQNIIKVLRRRAAALEAEAAICGQKVTRLGVRVPAAPRRLPPAAELPGS